MLILLFVGYFIAGAYVLTKMSFVKNAGLSNTHICLLFTVKVLAGISVAVVSHYVFNDATDYYTTNMYGLQEYEMLMKSPVGFIKDLFTSPYTNDSAFFGANNSYWNDLHYNIIYKTLAVLNIFSRGNYYINSLFFNFFGFIGLIALYRIFIQVYPFKETAIIIGCFLLPSTLYFGSGIHKDLIVLTALCFYCFALYQSINNGFTFKKIAVLLFSVIIILLIRNFIAVILVPASVAWFISKRYSIKTVKVFSTLVAIALLFSTLSTLNNKTNVLKIVADRQDAFIALGNANTNYTVRKLEPTISSFINEMPAALFRAFCTPYPLQFSNIYTNLLSIELICYWLLFVFMLIKSRDLLKNIEGFIFFAVFFSCTMLLFTGYISTNAGALIRYRSIYLPFLITPVLCTFFNNKSKTGSNSF